MPTESSVADALTPVAARIADWCRRMGETEKLLGNDIAHPMTSALHLWGFQLLPGADMGRAQAGLAELTKAVATVRTLGASLTGPKFLAMGTLQQTAIGKELEHQMVVAKGAVRWTIDEVRRANLAVGERDQMVADGAVEVDKFVVDKAPEVFGDIVKAITFSEHLGAAAENAGKVVLRGVTEVSLVAQGGKTGSLDADIGSLKDKAIDAAIDMAASFVPKANDSVRAVVRNMIASVVKSTLKAAKGKTGKELEEAVVSGVQDGLLSGLEGLAKDIPGLKDEKLRQQIVTPVIKALSGAAKAAMKGTSVAEGALDGALKGTISAATNFGKGKVVGHAEKHGTTGIGPDQQRALQDAYMKAVFGLDMRAKETVH